MEKRLDICRREALLEKSVDICRREVQFEKNTDLCRREAHLEKRLSYFLRMFRENRLYHNMLKRK